ncbi:MAG: hypothetical protein C0183_01005, partial [Roseiflexus castenholzii]
LLPHDEARTVLAQARTIAESGGRRRLLADIARVEYQLRLRMPPSGHSERSEESERVAQDPSL